MNDEQERIEEMAKTIIKAGESYYKMPVDIECANMEAVALYEEGYRKQSDTAREILQYLYEKMGNVSLSDTELVLYLAAQYGVEVEE